MGELLFHALMLLVFCGLFFSSSQIEIWNGYAGARYWPMTLTALAIILFAVKLIRIWRQMPDGERHRNAGSSLGGVTPDAIRLLTAFLLCFLYTLLLPAAGFLLSTFLFAAAFSRLLGAGKWNRMLLSGLCSAVPIFMVFVWGLGIRLPRGSGIFYTISLWLERLAG